MKNHISDEEKLVIRLETLEDMGKIPKSKLTKRFRKAIDDNKKLALAEAKSSTKKSWQDNLWIYLIVSFILGVVVTVISSAIMKYFKII